MNIQDEYGNENHKLAKGKAISLSGFSIRFQFLFSKLKSNSKASLTLKPTFQPNKYKHSMTSFLCFPECFQYRPPLVKYFSNRSLLLNTFKISVIFSLNEHGVS